MFAWHGIPVLSAPAWGCEAGKHEKSAMICTCQHWCIQLHHQHLLPVATTTHWNLTTTHRPVRQATYFRSSIVDTSGIFTADFFIHKTQQDWTQLLLILLLLCHCSYRFNKGTLFMGQLCCDNILVSIDAHLFCKTNDNKWLHQAYCKNLNILTLWGAMQSEQPASQYGLGIFGPI